MLGSEYDMFILHHLLFVGPRSTEMLVEQLLGYSAELQIEYLKRVAQAIQIAITNLPLPKHTQQWLADIYTTSLKLENLLLKGPKRDTSHKDGGIQWSPSSLPAKWRRPSLLLRSALKREGKNTEITDRAFARLNLAINPTHRGAITAINIIREIRLDTEQLESARLSEYSTGTEQNYNLIKQDKTLYLEFRRRVIYSLSTIHAELFNEPCDALTARVLTSFLHQNVIEKTVNSTRIKLSLPAKTSSS
jgi:hypothetical protein